tara:strand:+ start:2357 stop:2608 length:252 start_codon:yes stop_codon:yes gene_type:complete
MALIKINFNPLLLTEKGILYFSSMGISAIDAKKKRKNILTDISPYRPRIFAPAHEYPHVIIAKTMIIENFNSSLAITFYLLII